MKQKSKTAGGEPAAAENGQKQKQFNYPQYITPPPKLQVPSYAALGQMIDLSLYLVDYHTQQAEYHLKEAEYHRQQIETHKAIKRSLEPLIPGRPLSLEGVQE